MNKKFELICKMSQEKVKKYAEKALRKTHTDITVGDGFVFAKGTFPVLLVAHMDTVHDNLPDLILYDAKTDSMSSPNGIGGDDRCGIYMILEIVKHYNCSVLFCEDEEVGGIGAKKFIETDLAKELEFNYAIELDRKGNKDAVFYDCDNEEFEDFITKEFYKTAFGSYSDISTVAPFLGCAAVNLSCGYHNAHTKKEFVVLSEMEKSIEQVCAILERTTEDDKFEYIEAQYSWGNGGLWKGWGGYSGSYYGERDYGYNAGWYDTYDSGYDIKGDDDVYGNDDSFADYYIIEYLSEKNTVEWYDTYAVSELEAIGRFLMWHPTLCYEDIRDIMVDKVFGNK